MAASGSGRSRASATRRTGTGKAASPGGSGAAKAVKRSSVAKRSAAAKAAAPKKATAPRSATAQKPTASGSTAAKKTAAARATAGRKAAAKKTTASKKATASKNTAAAKKATAPKKATAGKKASIAKKTTAKRIASNPAATSGEAVAKPIAARRKTVASSAAAARTGGVRAGGAGRRRETPLGPEAMPRVRRKVDCPAPPPAPTRTVGDRSATKKPGLRELDWRQTARTARELAAVVTRNWSPELVVGLAKGGVFAGQELAQALKVPFFPVRVGKRSRDAGPRAPDAATRMPVEAEGKRVLVVDDIAGSGASLQSAAEAAMDAGAAEVRTASLVVREGGFLPDFFGMETSDLVVFPWDYEPSTGAVGTVESLDEFGV